MRRRLVPRPNTRRMSVPIPDAVYQQALDLRIRALAAGVDWPITQVLVAALEVGIDRLVHHPVPWDDLEGA